MQKTDRIPLALSRFLLRTAAGACKNRSAAPNTAPCFVRRTRSLCLPLLRLAASAAGSARLRSPSAHSGAPAACGRAPTVGGSVPQTALSTSAPHGGLVAENFAALPVGYFYPSGLRCPVFAAGDGAPLQKADRCPCSASPVSAAGSGSAAQPPAHRGNPGPAGPPLDRGSKPVTAPSNCRLLAAAKLWA